MRILYLKKKLSLYWNGTKALIPQLTHWGWDEMRHFADDTFKRIFWTENVRISIKISLKFVPKGQINKISALVQMMAWRRPGDKPLSEPMMIRSPTHIYVTWPQWVNCYYSIPLNKMIAETILWMRPPNERLRYNITLPFIGWAHSQNDV